MKVVLVSLINGGSYGHRTISAVLTRHGIEVHDIFGQWYLQDLKEIPAQQIEKIVEHIARLDPTLVGISVLSTFEFALAKDLSLGLKARSNCKVIFGGAHASLAPDTTLAQSGADFVCVGEGEESIVALCDELAAGKDGVGIPGILPRNGELISFRVPPQDLDALPFQKVSDANSFSVLEDGSIVPKDLRASDEVYYVRCSRGCPFECTFCSNAKLKKLSAPGRYVRVRSVESVIEELRDHVRANPRCKRIWFWDDTFPSQPAWVSRFVELYKKEINLPFWAWFHPKTVKEDYLRLLCDAGLQKAIVGIESATPATRHGVFGRRETNEEVLRADAILAGLGLARQYDFIVNHPWESPTELNDVLKMVHQFPAPVKINMHDLVILPSTKLAERAVAEGIFADEADIVKHITEDVFNMSRRFQWIKGLPRLRDLKKQYLVILIFLNESPFYSRRWLSHFIPPEGSGEALFIRAMFIPVLFHFVLYKIATKLISRGLLPGRQGASSPP